MARDIEKLVRSAVANLEQKSPGVDAGKLVLVEPEVPEITAGGEHGLLFFDGEYSHAITKGPILADDGGYLGGEYSEDITPVTPSDAEIELAWRCSRGIASPFI